MKSFIVVTKKNDINNSNDNNNFMWVKCNKKSECIRKMHKK